MIDKIIIRLEEPKDFRAVEELTRAAFNTPERIKRSNIGCPIEHYMVHRLREKDGIMSLNYVAELNGNIVGHIIYSNAFILQPDNSKVDVLNFGPISVYPKMQKLGHGSALMRYSIVQAQKLGYGAILFFGNPEYYHRFGFVETKEFGITTCDGENIPAFMAMELKEDYLKDVTGKFIEADIYNDDLNREHAKVFDKSFTHND
jgi:predicted N-acetyltransferase YhbS